MRAAVLDEPGPSARLAVRSLPLPSVAPGTLRIRVMAAGMNRSELHTRIGLAQGVTFPRVLGIEAVGVVDDPGDSPLEAGRQVATMMGGMGRVYDGGYAEYVVVPAGQVIPFTSSLDWSVLGAVPETLQTAYGSLRTGLDLQAGQTLLIRGGTSSTGLAAAAIAQRIGARVIATTRSAERAKALADKGILGLVDDGDVASQVRQHHPDGVDAALELVGTPTLPDTLRATRVHGTVCFTGMLSNQWLVNDFYPIDYLPSGVRLTAYGGNSSDLPAAVLQDYLDGIADGRIDLGPVAAYSLDQVNDAHDDMEDNLVVGKQVLVMAHN